MLRDSTPRYVGPSVGRSVGWLVGRSPFYFFGVFELFVHTALVTFSSTDPAHPHATRVAVYPACFQTKELKEWETDEQFQRLCRFAVNCHVTNAVAKHCVQLVTCYQARTTTTVPVQNRDGAKKRKVRTASSYITTHHG